MTAIDDAPTVRVLIFGEEYQIRSNRPEAHTRACARYVDDLIQRAHRAGVAETHRAAVLAALQITDELFEEKRQAEALAQTTEARLVELTEQLEALVGVPAAPEGDSKAEDAPTA